MGDQEEFRNSDTTTPARKRASAACDACRARKVKCNPSSGDARCTSCTELDLACTREKPRKKRGPKNRSSYVEALRARLDSVATQEQYSPPPASVAVTSPLSPVPMRSSLELIAPRPILDQLVNDWFSWIHFVAPIFHRGHFLNRIAECGSIHNGEGDTGFVILVASMCAATVASLRRRRSSYSKVTVDGCFELAENLGIWGRASIFSLERCLAFYNFASAILHEHGTDSLLSHRLMAEGTIGIKYLLYQGFDQMSFFDQQILKRLYWLMFAGQCTAEMYGRPLLTLRHVHEEVNALLPLEISDDELLADTYTVVDTPGFPTYVPGLNALSRLFMIWQSSQATRNKTMDHLQEHMRQAQHALYDLPQQLRWRSRPASPTSRVDRVSDGDFGTDVQTVNLKVTQLHIRANLLEQMNSLAKSQNRLLTPTFIAEERRQVVDELLDILYHMPHEVFDANGYSIVPKIRDIGSALIDEVRTGALVANPQSSLNLGRLLAKLNELDVRTTDVDMAGYA